MNYTSFSIKILILFQNIIQYIPLNLVIFLKQTTKLTVVITHHQLYFTWTSVFSKERWRLPFFLSPLLLFPLRLQKLYNFFNPYVVINISVFCSVWGTIIFSNFVSSPINLFFFFSLCSLQQDVIKKCMLWNYNNFVRHNNGIVLRIFLKSLSIRYILKYLQMTLFTLKYFSKWKLGGARTNEGGCVHGCYYFTFVYDLESCTLWNSVSHMKIESV